MRRFTLRFYATLFDAARRQRFATLSLYVVMLICCWRASRYAIRAYAILLPDDIAPGGYDAADRRCRRRHASDTLFDACCAAAPAADYVTPMRAAMHVCLSLRCYAAPFQPYACACC